VPMPVAVAMAAVARLCVNILRLCVCVCVCVCTDALTRRLCFGAEGMHGITHIFRQVRRRLFDSRRRPGRQTDDGTALQRLQLLGCLSVHVGRMAQTLLEVLLVRPCQHHECQTHRATWRGIDQ
jgi:hypothetical protein